MNMITKPNDRSAVIYWITGWRLLIIFTAFSFLSHSHDDSTKDVIHSVVLCVGMMAAVFGLTAYRFWPRLSFLFFIGTLAAHLATWILPRTSPLQTQMICSQGLS